MTKEKAGCGSGQHNQQIDFTTASRFLQALDPAGIFTFQTFSDTRKDPSLVKILHGSFAQHQTELTRLSEAGAGIFVTVNETDLRGRRVENIIGVRSLFLDLDGEPLPDTWPIEPHWIIETSPERYHAYWLVCEGFPLDRFEPVQKAIAAKFNGDPAVCDLPRVMRLPGFIHQKGDPFQTQIIRDWSSEPRYTADPILSAFPVIESPRSEGPKTDDPLLAKLAEKGMLLRPDRGEKGKFFIKCPWADQHTDGNTEAAYWQAHTGGKAGAGFKCQHAHCVSRGVQDLREWLGVRRESKSGGIVARKVSEVETKPISWLWEGYFPLGALCLVDGDPGLGKSFFTLDLAARVSSGRTFPTGERATPGGVVLLSYEDDPGVTIKPRLEAMAADLDRIILLEGVSDEKGPRLPHVADIGAIREAVSSVNARLVVIDPFMAALPGAVDSHSDQNIRSVLAPIGKLAQETGATVLIVRHLNKSGGGNALYRGGGSIGIVAAARAAYLVAKDPADPSRRILAVTKLNIAPEPPSLAYRIAVNTGGNPFLSWEGGSDLKAGDLLAEPAKERFSGGNKREQAKNFLRDILSNGPLSRNKIEQEAHKQGISEATLRRAKEDLAEEGFPIFVERIGGSAGFWAWSFVEGAHDIDTENPFDTQKTGEENDVQRSADPSLSPLSPLAETVVPLGDFKGAHNSQKNGLNPFKNVKPVKALIKGAQHHFIVREEPLNGNPLFDDSDFVEVE